MFNAGNRKEGKNVCLFREKKEEESKNEKVQQINWTLPKKGGEISREINEASIAAALNHLRVFGWLHQKGGTNNAIWNFFTSKINERGKEVCRAKIKEEEGDKVVLESKLKEGGKERTGM